MRNPLLFLLVVAGLAVAPAEAFAQPSRLTDLSLEELADVRIQSVFGATDRLQPMTEAPASVTIVTAEDIRRFGYQSLADILRGVRGLYLANDRNYTYLGVRGIGRPGDYNTRVLLLLNGRRLNDNVYDQAPVGLDLGVDVDLIARVEIIRGPASTLYGTNAFLGVINIITRSAADLTGVAFEAGVGSLGLVRGRATMGHTFGNGASLVMSVGHDRLRGNQTLYFPALDRPATNHGIADHLDGERVSSAFTQLTWSHLTLTLALGERTRDVPTASFDTAFNSQSPRQQTSDARSHMRAMYSATWRGTRLQADVVRDVLSYRGTYPYAAAVNGSEPTAARVESDRAHGHRWGATVQASRALPGRQTLTVGSEFIWNQRVDQSLTASTEVAPLLDARDRSIQHAHYLQSEIRIRPWLLATVGVRSDRYKDFHRTTPRAALVLLPSAAMSFKYLYGQAFRAPNAYERLYYAEPGVSLALRPELVTTHELVDERYIGHWLRTSVSAYHSRIRNPLEFRALSDKVYSYINTDDITTRGLELEAELRQGPGWSLTGHVSWQRASAGTTTRLTNSPPVLAGVRAAGTGPLRDSTWSLELQHVGQRITPDHTLHGHLTESTVQPAATLAHATVYLPLGRHWTLLASLQNALNARVWDPASEEHRMAAIEQNGRTVSIRVRWSPR